MASRKELKDQYKQRKAQMGVFQIRNIDSGKVLIDCSVDIPSSWNRTKAELRFGSHRCRELQDDWRALGEDGFELEVSDKENVDYQREVKSLLELVLEELDIADDLRYKMG